MVTLNEGVQYNYSPRKFKGLVDWVMEVGKESSPRGMRTKEIINAHFVVKEPRDRIIYDPARKMNIAFAIADFVSVLSGNDSLEFLTHFVPKIKDFSLDGRTVANAYGPRIRHGVVDQVKEVIEKLKDDKPTRQAVISIYGPHDFKEEPHVVPCTLTLQFLLRGDFLDLIVNMRSNDVIWGTSYDHFVFSMIQDYIAGKINSRPGKYYHNAGSLHIYVDRDKEMIDNLQDEVYIPIMAPIGSAFNPDRLYRRMWEVRDLYLAKSIEITPSEMENNFLFAARYWAIRKEKPREAISMRLRITSPAIKAVLENWPTTEG